MRFTTAYYLLLLYVIFLVKPVIPLIQDIISHTFEKAYHEATVHAKYGVNHAEKEMADAESSDNDSSKNQNTTKVQEETVVHLTAIEYNFDFSLNAKNKIFYSFENTSLPCIFLSKNIPPPKFAS